MPNLARTERLLDVNVRLCRRVILAKKPTRLQVPVETSPPPSLHAPPPVPSRTITPPHRCPPPHPTIPSPTDTSSTPTTSRACDSTIIRTRALSHKRSHTHPPTHAWTFTDVLVYSYHWRAYCQPVPQANSCSRRHG